MKRLLFFMPAVLLAACAAERERINREPVFSAVGSGLAPATAEVPPLAVFPERSAGDSRSLYAPGRGGLYRDDRARHVGDILTVEIEIDEQASLDSRADRARESEIGLDVSLGFPSVLGLFGVTGGGSATTGSLSSSSGEGSVDRSGALDLTLAAIVTSVLPNGNLVISGTQEVRVNHEMQVLSIAGIVRPRDVDPGNTIPYAKIAEARLSYGGRGRITEIQQPPYGQQIYDAVVPF